MNASDYSSINSSKRSIGKRICNLSRAVQVKEQVSEPVVRRLQIRCSWNFCKFRRKTYVLESLFNKAASLKTCNSVKKRLQHSHFTAKLAKFLRALFLQKSSIGSFWALTRVFKGVRGKNRSDCQQKIPNSAEKKYLLLRKSRSNHRRCFVKEDQQGREQVLSCEYYEISKNILKFRKLAPSENQHLRNKFTEGR